LKQAAAEMQIPSSPPPSAFVEKQVEVFFRHEPIQTVWDGASGSDQANSPFLRSKCATFDPILSLSGMFLQTK
jgi:hypothetical protein